MQMFSVQAFPQCCSDLIHAAENGELAIVTSHDQPLFLVVPFDKTLLKRGIGVTLAIRLFDEELVSLGVAARLAGVSVSEMIDMLGQQGISVIRTSESDLARELDDFA